MRSGVGGAGFGGDAGVGGVPGFNPLAAGGVAAVRQRKTKQIKTIQNKTKQTQTK